MENLFGIHIGRAKAGGRASAKHVGMPWAIIAIAIIVATVLDGNTVEVYLHTNKYRR